MPIQCADSAHFATQIPVSLHGSNASDIEFIVVNTAGRLGVCVVNTRHNLVKIDSHFYSGLSFCASPQDKLTVSNSEAASPPSHEPVVGLRMLVKSIREGRSLPPPSPNLDELLSRAAALHGVPDSIATWADQLAADVGDLTD
jgi:hypothetical protein